MSGESITNSFTTVCVELSLRNLDHQTMHQPASNSPLIFARATLRKVARALEGRYVPHRAYQEPCDPLDTLIETILSQNTTSANCERAFSAMRAAFPTWTDVVAAPRPRLERALRPAGLARTRSGRIQRILRAIQNERGQLDLRHLGKLPDEDARVALLSYEGVGPKTADCVLLFALGRSVFPVDTHIHRILTRLQILPVGMSVEKAHVYLLPLIPQGAHLSLHLNLIEHGRKVCRPRQPRCTECPLRLWCACQVQQNEP